MKKGTREEVREPGRGGDCRAEESKATNKEMDHSRTRKESRSWSVGQERGQKGTNRGRGHLPYAQKSLQGIEMRLLWPTIPTLHIQARLV